ncbi:MAG: hypothetical protein U5L00_09900 [Desulfovermiculus sp.]|nr:hypothetical protein [Desulfovermiculus sp.]
MAAFFYSFGAVADKMGVTVGQVSAYTLALCLCMLGFHLLRMAGQNHLGPALREMRLHPWIIICGGLVMMLSFITFRKGLVSLPPARCGVSNNPRRLYYISPDLPPSTCTDPVAGFGRIFKALSFEWSGALPRRRFGTT